MKDLSKLIILPLGFVALIGACAPYPPYPGEHGQGGHKAQPKTPQQTAADEEQRQIEESRRRLEREEARRRAAERDSGTTAPTPPVKPKYPTATAVPGKTGFVFNPYTQNIVDVKGIGSGKLVKDPEDSDPNHKFRVP